MTLNGKFLCFFLVVSTYKEPLEAWIDNFYGPTGVVAGTVSGLVRTMLVADDIAANIIPVDTCIAGVIAAAWDVGERGKIRYLLLNSNW